jgi:5-(carboxyamino)imidazole ribonucleotide mutase
MAARPRSTRQALVGIIMGSESDYETIARAEDVLRELDVPYEISVVSAHRTPERMFSYAKEAERRGLRVIIAGAGGAAHLPGMVASLTRLPVLGVPVETRTLKGIDSLLSIVQMPAGVPTATFAIGGAGAENAALFAARVLAHDDPVLAKALEERRSASQERAMAGSARVRERLEADARRTKPKVSPRGAKRAR